MIDVLFAGPEHIAPYLVAAAFLFAFGLLACVVRRNAVGYLIGIELMLNAGVLNVVAYGRFRGLQAAADSQIFGLFVIALAAAEAAVALALVYAVFRTVRDVDLDLVRSLRS